MAAKDSDNNNCFTSLVQLADQKQPEVDKTTDGRIIMSLVIVVIREKSKSTGIASDFQNSLLFSLFSGNFGTASLRMIGGEGIGVATRR
jgi:hypothetical protein